MGGYQSHDSSDKDLPAYDCHEKVLKDAQEGFSDASTTNCVIGDEEYYSAEEGDSFCSLTPERTRPESSSAEDSSDTSNEDDDCSVESNSQIESYEESSYVSEEEQHVPLETLTADVMSQESCSHCTIQDQANCKLQQEKASSLSNSCSSSTNKIGYDQDINCSSTTSQDPREQTTDLTNSASSIPKQLPPDFAVSDINGQDLSSKADITPSSESIRSESVLLTNRMSTSGCRKRKQVEYPKSSESETDEVENSRRHKSNKQRKLCTRRRNRSRHIRCSRNRRKSVTEASKCNKGNIKN